MTVKLLMDWPDSRDGKNYVAGNLLTTDAGTEAGLVAANMATTTLTGGTAYVAPSIQTQYRDAKLATDAAGNVFVLHPAIGDDFKLAQPTLLFESGAGFSRRADGVADTTKIVLCRVPLPKSKILNNCTIRVTHYWTFTSSGQTKNLCLGVDDTAAPSSYFVGSTSTGNAFHGIHELIFRGDKVSVIAPNQNYASGQSSNAPVSLSTKDFNEDRELVFYAYWNALSSGEWIELTYLKVEVQ